MKDTGQVLSVLSGGLTCQLMIMFLFYQFGLKVNQVRTRKSILEFVMLSLIRKMN